MSAYSHRVDGDQGTANERNYLLANYSGQGSIETAHQNLFRVSTEASIVQLAFTLLSLFIVVFGTISALVKEKIYAGEAIIATVVGVLIGPYCAGWFSPLTWNSAQGTDEITVQITRVVVVLSVFAIGAELPPAYVKKHWKGLALLLGPNMVAGWLVTGAFIYILVPGLEMWDSLVIAACTTPTDPVLASSVVGRGKFAQEHVPAHIRNILQCESATNDGAAFPLLYLALFFVLKEQMGIGEVIGRWIYLIAIYQVIMGSVFGAIIGVLARKMLKFSKRRSLIDRESMVAMYVALALLVTSVSVIIGTDEVLAAFFCGTAFAWDGWFQESIEDSNFSSILDLLANSAIFIFIGATTPFASFNDASITITWWRLVVLAIAVMLLRRIPAILAMQKWLPEAHTFKEALFIGHFGPIGVGALFISTLAIRRLPTPNFPPETHLDMLALSIGPINYFLMLTSILIHGLSIPVFTSSKRMSKRVYSLSRTLTANSISNEPSWLSRVRRQSDAKKPSDYEKTAIVQSQSSMISDPSSPPTSTDSPALLETPASYATAKLTESPKTVALPLQEAASEQVWPEGDQLVKEEVNGENVKVEPNPAVPQRSHHSDAQKHPHLQRVRSIAHRDQNKAEHDVAQARKQSADSETPSRQVFKKDAITGKLRPLTKQEIRAEEADRAARREAHYCSSGTESVWEDESHIIIERKDGEDLEIRRKERSPDSRPGMLSRLSGIASSSDLRIPLGASSQAETTMRPSPTASPSFRQRLLGKVLTRQMDVSAAERGDVEVSSKLDCLDTVGEERKASMTRSDSASSSKM